MNSSQKNTIKSYINVRLPVCREIFFPSTMNEPEMRTFSSFSSVSKHYS